VIPGAAQWDLNYYTELQQTQARPFGDDLQAPQEVESALPLPKEFFEGFLPSARGRALKVIKFTPNPGSFSK